jgi:hypothetical protein
MTYWVHLKGKKREKEKREQGKKRATDCNCWVAERSDGDLWCRRSLRPVLVRLEGILLTEIILQSTLPPRTASQRRALESGSKRESEKGKGKEKKANKVRRNLNL